MKEKCKILYIHHGKGIGGAPISLLNLILCLDRNKFDFKVAFVADSQAADLFRDAGIDVEIINGSPLYFAHHEKGKTPWWRVLKWLKIASKWKLTERETAKNYLEKKIEYDIVHLNSDVLSSWAKRAKILDFKVVCHNRDPIAKGNFGIRRHFLREILNKYVDAFISISEDNKSRLGLLEKTKVAYNFIKIPDSIDNIQNESQSDKLKILYMGGTAKAKGFKVVVDAIPYLNKNTELIMVGNYGSFVLNPKNFIDKLKNIIKLLFYYYPYGYIKKMAKSENVKVIGLVSNPIDYIRNCDILLSPFTIPHFSRPVMEAYACKKPVLVSDVKGMKEIVIDKKTGFIFPNKNQHKLAEIINWIANDKSVLLEMGGNCSTFSKEVFAPEINVNKIQTVYSSLCLGKGVR